VSRRWLAQACIKLERWQQAADEMGRLVEVAPNDPEVWYALALLRLGNGSAQASREVSAGMHKQFAASKDKNALFWLAWTCLLAPDALADKAEPLALVYKAFPDRPREHSYLYVLGIAQYRKGDYEECLKTFEESVAKHGKGGTLYEQLFLAMARQQVGQKEEAARTLEAARKLLLSRGEGNADVQLDLATGLNLQEFLILRREAEQIVGKSASGPRSP
jgi:Flp pilus assembly protein TadD